MRKWIQTITDAYNDICAGARPWVALGNFMNAWYDYAKEQRETLIADPLPFSDSSSLDQQRWAAFCAASVEYLCQDYNVSCPNWVHESRYFLSEPWFNTGSPHKPQARNRLIETTPEPFTRRNIYCGHRMFANKYEFAERHRFPSSLFIPQA